MLIKKLISLTKAYFRSFTRNIKITRVEFSESNCKVNIFFRGCSSPISLFLYEIIFDHEILSNLPSTYSALIGYYYGINYRIMTLKIKEKPHNFNIDNGNESINHILHINRKKLITFRTELKQEKTMHPYEILSKPEIINNFHPIQSCYIGIMAGLEKRIF